MYSYTIYIRVPIYCIEIITVVGERCRTYGRQSLRNGPRKLNYCTYVLIVLKIFIYCGLQRWVHPGSNAPQS